MSAISASAQAASTPLFHETFAKPESAKAWRHVIGVLTQEGPTDSNGAPFGDIKSMDQYNR